MAGPHRKSLPSSMMAMLDAKPAVTGSNGQDGQDGQKGQNGQNGQMEQYWTDVGDHLSPLRKHLISTYLHVSDEEAMPLLGEYFGVALSFVALGALVRSSNSSKRKHKKMMSEEEKLDIRSCSRFERMALESMLRESMERLGKLSKNAYELEVRERDLVEENEEIMVARDKEKVQLLKRVVDAEKVAHELRALRKAEGRANERVMSIVASKEQDWLKEKRNFQKEIEKMKETVTGMNREAKFQARRCRNPTCEHCKGVDRVARNAKGRISLRELHSLREASQAPLKREVVANVGRQAELSEDPQEIEEDRVLMKAIELRKKQRDSQNKVEKLQTGESSSGVTLSTSKEHLMRQQQDIESELASILERVGMLKQKSHLPLPGALTRKEGLALGEMLSVDNNEAHDGSAWEERTEEASVVPEPNILDPTLEVVDCASDQEEADPKVEREKALEVTNGEGILSPHEDTVSDSTIAESDTVAVDAASEDGEISSSINDEQQVVDVDDDLFAFQERLSLGDGFVHPEQGSESNEALEEEKGNLVADSSATADPAAEEETSNSAEGIEEGDAQEQQLAEEATTPSLESSKSDGEGISNAENIASPSVENALDDEQVLGVVEDYQNALDGEQILRVAEDDDTAEFCDALSSLDPATGVESEERGTSADLVSEEPVQNHSEYNSALDVNENWGFEDPILCTEEEGLVENQDIPVFERKNSDDDLAGELPEPEEKRVCGLETLDSNNTLSPTELLSTGEEVGQQEGNVLKGKDNATIEEVGSQDEEGLFEAKTGSDADVKPKSDTVIARSVDLEPAEIIT